jgi:two-component system sensor histidine kinase KdpD
MRSRGELRAVLRVSPLHGAALYTQEDLHLLETLASLGALALHNAAAVQELESLRRLEVGAARDEKRLALGALSMELCHEMVYPLNFLRDLLRRSAGGPAFDGEDLSFARMEVSRMDRLIDSLRRLDLPPPRLGELQLLEPIHRALLLLREPIQERKLSVSVEVSPELRVNAETDSLIQLFSNLLRNAAQSTPEGGAIGVRYHEGPAGPCLDIWDTGPGIPEEVASVLFTRRVSTKPEGYGIGLTVVHRIARSFQWEITFLREEDRTCFRLTLHSRPEHLRHE